MNAPLNGVAEIPKSIIQIFEVEYLRRPAIELVGPWNLLIRVSYSQNYKIVISDKIACWEGEQFPLAMSAHTTDKKKV